MVLGETSKPKINKLLMISKTKKNSTQSLQMKMMRIKKNLKKMMKLKMNLNH